MTRWQRLQITFYVAIRGRSHTDKQHINTPCILSNEIEPIQGYGYNILKDICTKCACFDEDNRCEYLAQFDKEANVRIYTHSYLCLQRTLDKNLPDRIIIDERFYTNMINTKIVSLSLVRKLVDHRDALNKVLYDALVENKPLLATLKNQYEDNLLDVLKNAIKSFDINLPKLPAVNSLIKNIPKLINKLQIPEKQTLALMLTNIMHEISKFPDRRDSVSVKLEDDQVMVATHSIFDRFIDDEGNMKPVLCIDADFSKQVTEVFLPNIKHSEFYVERNAYITQIYSTTNAKTRFISRKDDVPGGEIDKVSKQRIKEAQCLLDNIYTDYGKFLLISYQDLVGNPNHSIQSKLKLPKECEAIHFGGLRGLNKYKDMETVIIIGRNQLPTLRPLMVESLLSGFSFSLSDVGQLLPIIGTTI